MADKDTGLPLGDIALDMVRRPKGGKGPETYIIHPKGPEVIQAAVKATLLSGESPAGMAKRFKQVLLVCYVLEEKKGCPKAARVLVDALFADPEVAKVLGGAANAAQRTQRQYRKFLDDRDVARAPNIRDKAPEDALKVTAFLSPGQQDMMSRARQSAARRQQAGGAAGAPKAPAAKPPGGEPGRRPGLRPRPGEAVRRPRFEVPPPKPKK